MRGRQLIFRGMVGAAIGMAPLFLGGFARGPGPSKPAEITITGADYAFVGVPQQIKAGQALFSFKNAGKVRHELVIARLTPGTTPEQIVEKLKKGALTRDVIKVGGLLFADAGESNPIRLSLNLTRGEHYMVYCNYQDTLNAPRHWALGMYSGFSVR